MNPLNTNPYDVFISYRREHGAEVARLIRYALMDRGLKVFLDVENLGSGHFDEKLLDTIGATPGFVVILSKDSLARCNNPVDWVRREIVHAVDTQRTIVPVMAEGFEFGSIELPEELKVLQRHNGLKYNHDYFEAMITKLLEYLALTAVPKEKPSQSAENAPSPAFVFLDFDGVLRLAGGKPYVFDKDCLGRFENLMRRHPASKIVVTSSWRLGMSKRELVRQFSPDIQPRIVDVTPECDTGEEAARHSEILQYLKANGGTKAAWIAIDDDAQRYRNGCRNLLLTDPQRGFDDSAVERFGALLDSADAR